MAPQINVKSYVCYSELGTIVDRHTCTFTFPVHLSKGTTADVNVDESTLYVNVDESTLYSEYFHWFKIIKFYNI